MTKPRLKMLPYVLLALLLALALLYTVPYSKKIDLSVTGFLYSPESDGVGERFEITLKGKYDMYLLKPDVCDVAMRLSGHDGELLVRGNAGGRYGVGIYTDWRGSVPPNTYGTIYVKGAFKSFLIMLPTDAEGGNRFIVAPAATREEAAEVAAKTVAGTFLGISEDYWKRGT